ncbi:hypothetical protein OSTOST_20249 [Ostertagia ostertagi]
MYFGHTSTPSLLDEGDETAVSDLETGPISEKKPPNSDGTIDTPKPVPKRDIAKMMWEAADLYDNAIRAIQERRAELQKRKERKKAKIDEGKAKDSTESSDDIDPEAIVRDIVKSSHQRAARERKHGIGPTRKPFPFTLCGSRIRNLDEWRTLVKQLLAKASRRARRGTEDGSQLLADNGLTDKRSEAKKKGGHSGRDSQRHHENGDRSTFFKKKGTSLHMTKAAVISVIEEVQRYIIDQLKLDPVDFVSVRLQSTASSTRLILKAQDRAPRVSGKIQKIRL